jgi:hypothetical protein
MLVVRNWASCTCYYSLRFKINEFFLFGLSQNVWNFPKVELLTYLIFYIIFTFFQEAIKILIKSCVPSNIKGHFKITIFVHFH